MRLPDISANIALYQGLRQAEAVRDALCHTLSSNVLPFRTPTLREWLATQEVRDYGDEPSALFSALKDGYIEGIGDDRRLVVRGSNAPSSEAADRGEERAGAGWKDPASFVITSAFVRLLGTSEQFELDVLKALFYYRPSGLLGQLVDSENIYSTEDVIFEKPAIEKDDREVYSKPTVWTWLRKQAENNVERATIFKRVFDIDLIPPEYKKNNPKREWYEKRNAIAHGRASVKMTLGEYIKVEVFVAKSMAHVSDQCRDKLKVIL